MICNNITKISGFSEETSQRHQFNVIGDSVNGNFRSHMNTGQRYQGTQKNITRR